MSKEYPMRMSFLGCMSGSGPAGPHLQAIEDAVKENAITRLTALLEDGSTTAQVLDQRHLVHQASWLGYPQCVRLLLKFGADSDRPHKKNGCTPLHLAHFCQVEDTNPSATVEALVAAGANVNNTGSPKCGRYPLDHAIQQQRLDSVQVLISAGAHITLQSVLITIDVANPQILELLLASGAQCGPPIRVTPWWGQPLHRLIYTPLKCPRVCYKTMFRRLVQATVCCPLVPYYLVAIEEIKAIQAQKAAENQQDAENQLAGSNPEQSANSSQGAHQNAGLVNEASGGDILDQVTNFLNSDVVPYHRGHQLMIESELRTMAQDYTELTQYLYAYLLRNGFRPSESIRRYMEETAPVDWAADYLTTPVSLKDVCMRVVRTYLHNSGNILNGLNQLQLAPGMRKILIMTNPL